MLVLKTLGVLDLRRSGGEAVHVVLRQPKCAALLVYLAASHRTEYVRRDTLLPLFWPESTEVSARHSLAQALYRLRGALGSRTLDTRGDDELRLRPEAIWCDASAFREASAARRYEEAWELYIGEFLLGLHVPEADGFERWMETERDTLRREAARVGWALAREQIARRAIVDAGRTARRCVDLDPSDEVSIRGFLTSLAAAGASATAVLFYEHVRAVLAERFDVAPAAETRLVLASIRASAPIVEPASVSALASPHAEFTERSAAPNGSEIARTPRPQHWNVAIGRAAIPSARGRTRRAIGLAVAFAITIMATGPVSRDRSEAGFSTSPIASLVVMPLDNITGDPAQDYFVEGMYDALVVELAQLQGLRVVPRPSAEHYAHGAWLIQDIARDLKVDAIIEGSVSRTGERVRIQLKLLRVKPERNIWTQTYERDVRDVLALHRDVARAVATEIQLELPAREGEATRPARSVNPAAYDAWLKGAYHRGRRSGADTEACIRYAKQAVAADPSYAPAFVLLAQCHNVAAFVSPAPPQEAFEEAKRAARHALELDEALAPAYAVLGYVMGHYEWDWSAAERSYRKALELNPALDEVEGDLGWLLATLGRFDEALAHARRAENLNPMSPQAVLRVGMILHLARRHDEALVKAQRAIVLDSAFMFAYDRLHWAYDGQSRHQEAVTAAEHAVALSGDRDLRRRAFLAHAYALAGHHTKARNILRDLIELQRDTYVPPTAIAAAYVGLRDTAEALRWLERGVAERDGDMVLLKTFPLWDPLRSDARFQALLRRMRFPD